MDAYIIKNLAILEVKLVVDVTFFKTKNYFLKYLG